MAKRSFAPSFRVSLDSNHACLLLVFSHSFSYSFFRALFGSLLVFQVLQHVSFFRPSLHYPFPHSFIPRYRKIAIFIFYFLWHLQRSDTTADSNRSPILRAPIDVPLSFFLQLMKIIVYPNRVTRCSVIILDIAVRWNYEGNYEELEYVSISWKINRSQFTSDGKVLRERTRPVSENIKNLFPGTWDKS